MAGFQRYEPFADCFAKRTLERRYNGRSCSPCDVETRHGIAVAICFRAPAFCPTHNREPAHPQAIKPGPHFSGRKRQISFGPTFGPMIFGTVKLGRAEPILPREINTVLDAKTTLFGTVDHKQSAK